jgi:hypothetical protein
VGGQFQRDGAADSPARPGHNGCLILKLFHRCPSFNHESAQMPRKNDAKHVMRKA